MAKILNGKVTSIAMTGTIIVEVTRHTPHPLYKKLMKRSKKYHVDPRGQEVAVGDLVSIVETKPVAKNKHFALVSMKETKSDSQKEEKK